MTNSTNSQNKNSASAGKRGVSVFASLARKIALASMALMAVSTTGCFGVTNGYNIGPFGWPIPVSPYYQHKAEEDFWKKRTL